MANSRCPLFFGLQLKLVILVLVLNLFPVQTLFAGVLCHRVHLKTPLQAYDLLFGDNPRYQGLREWAKVFADNPEHFARSVYADGNRNIGIDFLAAVTKINPALRTLVFHPGIVFRQNQLFEFLKDRPDLVSAESVYLAFNSNLGTSKYYRALVLTEPVAKAIQNGSRNVLSASLAEVAQLNASMLKKVEIGDNSNVWKDEDSVSFQNIGLTKLRIFESLDNQFKTASGQLLLSISKVEEIAVGVAHRIQSKYSGPKWKAMNFVYLLEVQVPNLDVIAFQQKTSNIAFSVGFPNGLVKTFPLDANIESFLLFGLDRSEVKSVTKIDLESAPILLLQTEPRILSP